MYIGHQLGDDDLLLDDYSKNLHSWCPPGSAVKLMNGINGNFGTWKGATVSYLLEPEKIAETVTEMLELGGNTMNTPRDWDINEIEGLTEKEAQRLAQDHQIIKEHDVYFTDFGGPFGYSALVFRDGHYIYFANDYALHHQGKNSENLRQIYTEELNGKLFTENELAAPLTNYSEYRAKQHFLVNYYGMQKDHISKFTIFHSQAEEQDFDAKIKGMTYDPISYAYYNDAGFVAHHVELADALGQAKTAKVDDYDFMRSAFLVEMYNHEYGYNPEGKSEVFSALGIAISNFTETQRRAFTAARAEYFEAFERFETEQDDEEPEL